MRFARIFVAILVLCSAIYAEDEFRKRGESATKNQSAKSTQNRQDSAYQKRSDSPKIAPKNTSDSQVKARDSRVDSRVDSQPKATKDLKSDSQPQKATNQTPKNQKTAQDSKDSQPQKTTKKPQSTQNKSAEIKKITKKKPLGYRNVTIQNIKKQQKVGIDFFVGLQFGVDIVSMQDISENANGDKTTKNTNSASASFGLKLGIISEDEWVGGRFYAEASYLKIPKFDVLNVGVDLDLLIKYYEAPSYKIGGFIGAGGGMNSAFIADKSLESGGTKSLISVGWVNVGLLRFVYFHSTGIHGAELNAKIVYVTPTIYSLKDKNTGVTTSYKASSSTIMLSYTYQF